MEKISLPPSLASCSEKKKNYGSMVEKSMREAFYFYINKMMRWGLTRWGRGPETKLFFFCGLMRIHHFPFNSKIRHNMKLYNTHGTSINLDIWKSGHLRVGRRRHNFCNVRCDHHFCANGVWVYLHTKDDISITVHSFWLLLGQNMQE